MSDRLHLITCSSFDREVQAVQGSPDLQEVRILAHPVNCDLADSSWSGLGESLASCRKDGCPVGLVGGFCLTRPVKDLGLDGSVRVQQESPCLEWIADKGLLDRLLHDGALPVLPGWLKDWEAHVEARWPSDRKSAQAFFRDVARRVVLLDTGVHAAAEHELRAFGRFLRLPTETRQVGLEHFRLSLSRFVLAWRMERLRTENADRLALFGQRIGDIARIGRLLGAVTSVRTFDEAQAGVIELFRVMLAPDAI